MYKIVWQSKKTGYKWEGSPIFKTQEDAECCIKSFRNRNIEVNATLLHWVEEANANMDRLRIRFKKQKVRSLNKSTVKTVKTRIKR